MRMTAEQDRRDSDLITVAAVEEYARRHDMSVPDTISLFDKNNLFALLRESYGVLHTLDLDEGASFAEDVIRSRHDR